MEIRNLSDISYDCIICAFQEAFSDYAVSFSSDGIMAMFKRRGFTPQLSFGAFQDGKIVSFLFNGTGLYGGTFTAYDCGTGTIPAFRGRGLAGTLFEHAVPLLREAGMKRYLLEVLKSNTTAINIYSKAGFETIAEYECFTGNKNMIARSNKTNKYVEIHGCVKDLLYCLSHFCDFTPSWQNSVESIARGFDRLIMRIAMMGDKPVGYIVADPSTGDISQIAVDPAHRRCGIATALLRDMLQSIKIDTLKVLNIDRHSTPMIEFLNATGFCKGLPQYAMSKSIIC